MFHDLIIHVDASNHSIIFLVQFLADTTINQAASEEWDLIALPGGMPGAEHLRDCPPLIDLLHRQKSKAKLYGAICASPAVVLSTHGLVGAAATCYPADGLRKKMTNPVDDEVVVQGNVVYYFFANRYFVLKYSAVRFYET